MKLSDRVLLRSLLLMVIGACTSFNGMIRAQQTLQPPPATIFREILVPLKQQTRLPVLLPAHLPPLSESEIYAHESGGEGSYSIRIESDPDCDGADACYVGIFRARRGGQFSFPEVVRLGEGDQARYKGITCGGSCSSAAIEWKFRDTLYTVQLTLATNDVKKARSLMLNLARESLIAGPR